METPMQLPAVLFSGYRTAFKEVLDHGEIVIKDRDKYQYFRTNVMRIFYHEFRILMSSLQRKGLVVPCGCGSQIERGYNDKCKFCNGSEFKNSEDLQVLVMRD